ncbi:cytochrome C oxidase [Bacteroidetes bacterium UKL13-3]|jgi:cytochrome c oxidase accessory protein FixG|nr:cytochrome C oxidase [Bacteroidetes bacterium UKL13-3]HCP93185.1 cytochrome c oxidase accessory protein CcoG [Bacteroidota bacterium]
MPTATTESNEDSYRDSISLVDKGGHRNWVYPKKPKGPLYNGRTWFSILLMTLLFAGPFLKLNGHPILLLNILQRKFIILGIPFWPQDMPLFALLMITFVMFIIVFTVVFGRLFCGWACPQTIFMEMLFRKIEYWIEGDYKAQKKLDEQEWNTNKITKKGIKHILFFVLAVAIANTFLSYLIGIDEVKKLITDGPMAHKGQFIALIIFSTAFYAVFAKFREIVCIVVCPYGRLQGLMLDKNSIVVAYDFVRGEPRGFRKKGVEQSLGDCVDCHRCVQVCPTGIDIRNGTQLECINCTACIDECNDVMEKIHQPKGLIRYASQEEISRGSKKRVTLRSVAYMTILVVLISVLTYLLATRDEVATTILRTPGMLYQQQDAEHISNMYNFEVVNKTFDDQHIDLKIKSPANTTLKMVDRNTSELLLKEDDIVKGSFFLIMPQQGITQNNIEAEIELYSNGNLIKTIKTNFVAPVK